MTRAANGMGVIFDLDGVLIDSGWAHKQAWYDLAEKERFSMSDDFFYSTFGMQNYQIIPMLLTRQASRCEIDRMSRWKEQRYRELIADRPVLLDGVEALLDDLKSSGFLLAIGSSAPRANLDLIRGHLRMDAYFGVFVTSEDVRRSKPAPDTFLRAAEKLSLAPGRCAVVEDAVQGVEAANAAGMPVVAVTNTRSRADLSMADRIVDSLAELKAEDFLRLLNSTSR